MNCPCLRACVRRPSIATRKASSFATGSFRRLVIVAGEAKAFADGLKQRRPNLEVVPVGELDLDSPDLRKGE